MNKTECIACAARLFGSLVAVRPCGPDTFVGEPGSFVFVPRGAAHGYTVGPHGGRVLVVTPAGLERYFAEVADRLRNGPVSMEDEAEIAARYGQDFLDRLRHWGQ